MEVVMQHFNESGAKWGLLLVPKKQDACDLLGKAGGGTINLSDQTVTFDGDRTLMVRPWKGLKSYWAFHGMRFGFIGLLNVPSWKVEPLLSQNPDAVFVSYR